MKANLKKGTTKEVMNDIKPYIQKSLFSSSIDYKNVPLISKILLSKYSNVRLQEKVESNTPILKITVKDFLLSDSKTLTITGKKINNLDWIDKLEMLDAIFDD